MDQALLTFHNGFPEGVDVFYTSDYCYKCLPQPLASVERDMSNVSSVISTKFTLSLRVVDSRNVSLCSWSQTYEEGGQYSVWIQQQTASNTSAICRHSVDENPRNAYLPVLVALLVLAVVSLLFVLVPYVDRKYNATKRIKNACCPSRPPRHTVDCVSIKAPLIRPPDTERRDRPCLLGGCLQETTWLQDLIKLFKPVCVNYSTGLSGVCTVEDVPVDTTGVVRRPLQTRLSPQYPTVLNVQEVSDSTFKMFILYDFPDLRNHSVK
ncbi:unnamed protein product [Boreogadus saida]